MMMAYDRMKTSSFTWDPTEGEEDIDEKCSGIRDADDVDDDVVDDDDVDVTE